MSIILRALFIISVALGIFTAAHARSVPCNSLWTRGFPSSSTDPGTCYLFLPTFATLNDGQQMFTQNSTAVNPLVKERMDWAAEAFVYASDKYSAFASVPKIRMVWSESAHEEDTEGYLNLAMTFVEFYDRGREFCPILIYPSALSLSKEHFYQLMAHEIYHCVQVANFPDQVMATIRGYSEGNFWLESIAQFMGNDVYPSFDLEYHPRFGTFDSHLPFFQQATPYLSEGFFQSLFWFMGSSASSLHTMQNGFSSSGASAIDDALTIPRISEAFHEYSRKISFKELMDSSDVLAPWTAEKQIHLVPEEPSSSISISFMDFATEPFEITFPKGGHYRLNIHRVDGAKLSVRKKGTTAWQESFQTDFITECDKERTFEGIYTRAHQDLAMNAIQIDITREENPACPCDIEEKPKDKCLYGEWQMDPATLRQYMVATTAGVVQPDSLEGDIRIKFNSEGDYDWSYNNVLLRGIIPDRRMPRSMTWNMSGVHSMKYSSKVTSGGRWLCSRTTSANVLLQIIVSVNGNTYQVPGEYSGVCEGTYNYQCDARTFSYTARVGMGTVNYRFFRLTPPPADL